MPTLHLGVTDIPYANAPASKRGKRVSGTQTTGDVAGWLEDEYGVMQYFFDHNEQFVADEIAGSVGGALESMMMGAPMSIDPFGAGTNKIDERFKDAIDNKEFDGLTGVPTAAAQRGVNHRLKHPYRRRQPRPSFQDTGLYQTSFKSWVDG